MTSAGPLNASLPASIAGDVSSRNVAAFEFGAGAFAKTAALVDARRPTRNATKAKAPIFLIDAFFSGAGRDRLSALGIRHDDGLRFVDTTSEPTTDGVDELIGDLRASGHTRPCAIVGMGGGATLDSAKAVANLFTNRGRAVDYQGWDLVHRRAVYKIGVPTISGTGAESSRTCVLVNPRTGLKLGMNSDHTVYDHLVLDPDLPSTVSRRQFLYTGMDTFVHCFESLRGTYRHAVADALCNTALQLCCDVFAATDMMSPRNRQQLMAASYLGGCAIANSRLGVVHPLSAGLSVVLGIHHCLANCIVMSVMDEFYAEECRLFRSLVASQGIVIPSGVCAGVEDEQIAAMCVAALQHGRPLSNALGPDYHTVLPPERIAELYRHM